MKIFVKKSEEKSIPIIVTGDLKIMELKIALIDVIGACVEDMFLSFEDNILEEEKTLEELGIQTLCTINLCKPRKILIYIKTEDENEIPAVITNNIKVKKLLEIIQSALEFPTNEQCLYFESKLLEPSKSLFEQGIRHLSSIQLNNSFIQGIELSESVYTLTEQDVQPSSISQLSTSPSQKNELLKPSKTLINQDNKPLSTKNSNTGLLQHSHIEPRNINLYIKTTLGEKLSLIVSDDMQIKNVIKLIKMNLYWNASGKSLEFNGLTLDKKKTLKELGILNNSKLLLIRSINYYM